MGSCQALSVYLTTLLLGRLILYSLGVMALIEFVLACTQYTHRWMDGVKLNALPPFFEWVATLFVCVEVLRPSQPNGVMSSAVSLPSQTFTGQV